MSTMSRMSVRSTASATSDFGGVVLAVEHLQELGRRMRGDDFDFKEDDVSNLDIVVDAIHELEKERLHLHELLETQTIQGSVLRHRLLFYPAEIQKEIDEAVISARQSNAEAQKSLQETLESIYRNVEFLEGKQGRLEKENAVLHPERELIRQQHEEIISQLNQRMAEKAGMQITLNETRDKVRQANQCILELEDGIVQLKEDLIQERQEARDEKRRLKSQANETAEKTKQQRATNFEKKKQLDSLKENLLESNGNLESLKKSVRRLENSRGKLEEKEKILSMNLKKEIGDNAELRDKGISTRDLEKKETAEYEAQREQLEARINQLDADIAKQHKLSAVVNAEHSELAVEVKGKVTMQNNNRIKVKELEKMLQTAKSALSSKAEESGNLENENETLQLNINEMEDSHKIVVAQLNSHIEEYRDQLGKERKERMELQVQRDSVQKDLEDIKTESQNFVIEVNKKINEGKTKHQELSQEGTSLQKQLREDDSTLRKLQKELSELQAQFKEKSTEKKGELAKFEEEVAQMETAVEDKKDLLAAQTPAFEELEAQFEEKTQHYDEMKKDIVKKKNLKSLLLEAIKKAKLDKDKISSPQAGMKEMLSDKRRQSIVQLKSHAEETRNVEKEICVIGCRLTKVQDENQKFSQHIKKLQDRIEDLRTQQKDHHRVSNSLKDELQKLKEELINGWREDREMEQMFAERDEAVVKELAQILVKTEKRETKIADISSQLQSELLVLGDFLDNVSRRRPVETRDGKRPPQVQQVDSVSSTSNLNVSKNGLASESKSNVTNSAESSPTNSAVQLNTATAVDTHV